MRIDLRSIIPRQVELPTKLTDGFVPEFDLAVTTEDIQFLWSQGISTVITRTHEQA